MSGIYYQQQSMLVTRRGNGGGLGATVASAGIGAATGVGGLLSKVKGAMARPQQAEAWPGQQSG